MQNFNDINKQQQMQQMQTIQQIPNKEGAGRPAPSKFNRFAGIALFIILSMSLLYMGFSIVSDNTKTIKQIDTNLETFLNSPKIQEYRAKEARRQRELKRIRY